MTKEKTVHIVQKPQEQHWVGDGFHVHTLLSPHPELYNYASPFLLLDYAPPRQFPGTEHKHGVGVHPHRGFETVTFALQGEVEHRDSSGGGGIIKKGDVQWMTAASGLVHEEFHSRDFASSGGQFEMVQLWVNLPAKDKMAPPRYQGVKNELFPRLSLGAHSEAQLVAGEYKDQKGPCQTFTDIRLMVLDSPKKDHLRLDFPEGFHLLVLILRGEVSIHGKSYLPKELLIMTPEGESLPFETSKDCKILVMAGEPIDEPVVSYGPFVMNTVQEIHEAIEDFNSGKMGNL